ncbi:HAD family hydrolase [Peptostreptococcus equinus]|uniref:HAD family hydrolase n=1 Tax=Peptostreptococcus equinus TaxID=3003601 RepID=A0ABY7JQR3_9FIRM|nr:HAD family hydrolase [Peptostreptococcus sp. CBA3647]WAW14513.1 HAD family hydrolase [Peptostreptococcus sp. CBA3647]
MASGSNNDHIINNIEKNDVSGYFDVIASGEEVQNGKPSPDVFLLAAQKLNINPENCLVLEDSSNGIEAAKAAGMYRIMVPDSYQPDEKVRQESNAIVDNLYEVRFYLEDTNKLCI